MKTLIIGVAVIAILAVIYFSISKRKKTVAASGEDQDNVAQVSSKGIMRETIDDWKRNFSASGLGRHWDFFKPLLRDEILITTESALESDLKIGQSKIGGQPDLPENVAWFGEDNGKSLSFIAQINFAETKAFDKSGMLPTRGIVYFFYSAEQEAWGFDPNDKDKFKVYYFDGDEKDLRRADIPADLDPHSWFKPCKLSYSNAISLPNWEQEYLTGRLSDKEQDVYLELSSPEGETNKLLGHSDNIQGPMEEECQLVTNGLFCGDSSGYDDPRATALRKDSDRWRLLFQIDSIDIAEMMWGDAGRLYFWIREDDLKKKAFDKTWFVLQCS